MYCNGHKGKDFCRYDSGCKIKRRCVGQFENEVIGEGFCYRDDECTEVQELEKRIIVLEEKLRNLSDYVRPCI